MAKRFRYLLGLTDLFRHFIDIRAKNDPEIKKILRDIDRANSAQASGSRRKTRRSSSSASSRRRKTEKEEDAELLLEEEDEDPDENTIFTQSPSYIQGTLREYQIQGLNWLVSLHENSISGILADEMGLGKTLQTISFLGYLRFIKDIPGPHLVIVPKSTLNNWAREFNKWIPEINTLVIQGDKDTRGDQIANRLFSFNFDVCITSYEVVIREKSALKKIAWQYIVVDEAHRIKNEASALSQIIRLFYSRNRLLITGTPLQNNLHELWALLNFILPDVFTEAEAFDQWFTPEETEDGQDQDSIVQQLHKVLQPFLLRRVKADVEKSLLPKKEINLYVGMSEMQVKWYKRLLEKDIDAVNGAVGKREGKTRLLNIVMQLRKCCNHPYLFEGAEPGPPYTTDEHLVYNCGKMVILDKLLKRLKEQGSRVLIFSQMSRLLDILEDYCVFRDYEYCRIDGSTDHEDRIAAIDEYNKPDSDKFVFLLTTRAGGLGINLTTADIVILYDSDWNPQADLQAMDRAHRIGQTKQVYVFRFVTENAVEEKVLERAAQKLRLDQLVIQQGRVGANNPNANNPNNPSTSKDDLVRMIQFGAENIFSTASGGTMKDNDIDSILKHGEERTKELNARYSKLGLDDLQKFTTEGSAYEWNGEDFKKNGHAIIPVNTEGSRTTRGARAGNQFWINPSKRERKGATYSIDDYYKDILQTKDKTATRTPRPPKQITIQDFQFFPKRLRELQEKEMTWYRKQIGYRVGPSNDGSGEPDPKERERLNALIEAAEPLTQEEIDEKAAIIKKGFSNWSKRDLTNFIHQSARYGRTAYQQIAGEMDGKSSREVERYAKMFWEHYKEIEGWERYMAQIETGEERLKKLAHQQKLLRQKIEQYTVPQAEMIITYPANNSKKTYNVDEDRFILLCADKYGLASDNLWEKVQQDIKKSPLFRFDWFFLSRTPVELSRRCATLLLAVTREIEGPNAMKRKSGPKRGSSKLGTNIMSAADSPSTVETPGPTEAKEDGATPSSTTTLIEKESVTVEKVTKTKVTHDKVTKNDAAASDEKVTKKEEEKIPAEKSEKKQEVSTRNPSKSPSSEEAATSIPINSEEKSSVQRRARLDEDDSEHQAPPAKRPRNDSPVEKGAIIEASATPTRTTTSISSWK